MCVLCVFSCSLFLVRQFQSHKGAVFPAVVVRGGQTWATGPASRFLWQWVHGIFSEKEQFKFPIHVLI